MITRFLFAVLAFTLTGQLYATVDANNYPHWNINHRQDREVLEKIDAFIQHNKNKQVIAVFDWDGTVYDETIRVREKVGGGAIKSSQAVWHVWAANNVFHKSYAHLNFFPHYHDCEGNCVLESFIHKDDYLEGLTPNQSPMDNYSKFSQIAVVEAGMTPHDFMQGVAAYEAHYPVKRFAFLPMFDVIQQMINNQIKVWFISGSNPYFIATLLKKVEALDPRYDFSSIIGPGPFNAIGDYSHSRIIGNHAKVHRGKFTRVYDDRYLKRERTEPLNVIVNEGKAIAMRRFIAERDAGKILFAAGNSNGDLEMMTEVIKQPDSLVLAINPAEKLKGFLQKQNKAQVLLLNIAEDQE